MDELTKKIVARFQVIDAERMRDLPIYNAALIVEAINFQPIETQSSKKALIGALITPWFINIMLIHTDEIENAQLGERISYQLPAGDFEFMVGEDEELGRYDFHTLASPVLKCKTQHSAQSLAEKGLRRLLTPPELTENETSEQHVRFDTTLPANSKIDNNRRDFLRKPFERLQNS